MLIRRIAEVNAADIATVGGKGANLGELVGAHFPVPDGFILTTEAYTRAAESAGVDPHDAAGAADRLQAAPVPTTIADAACQAYATLGAGRVAVRSSATAEDLPGASFAGQQDTYLNVEGEHALLDAIRRCWASLWNQRAVAYRRANNIEDVGVSLAVVVQRMVPASAAGVLFTADPVTGRHRRATIDVIADLGEKLVSGAINPDHFAIDTARQNIVDRQSGSRQAVLSDRELLELASLGDRVERHFGAPQDIEFAFDDKRRLWLVQSRPITTLYPLPERVPDAEQDLRVYFSANTFQGYFEPLTPMGIQFFRLLGTAVYRSFGAQVTDALAGPKDLVEAGMRLYVDITSVVRDPFGLPTFKSILSVGEARSSLVLAHLASDPRLAIRPHARLRTLSRIGAGVILRFLLRRFRELIGSREAPKYHIIRLLATPARELLKPVGADLAVRGRIREADDIFFLTLLEARRAVAGEDVSEVAVSRRRMFERERARRHIPRILLSDGTDAEAALVSPSTDALRGSPASPGVVTSTARVVRSPRGAHLEPGEILVAPSTDPGWTPLFLTAGGLVMEMGGMMSHGAVVAREYGIPAVVGVAGATERIATGQLVTVDGSAGTVTLGAQAD